MHCFVMVETCEFVDMVDTVLLLNTIKKQNYVWNFYLGSNKTEIQIWSNETEIQIVSLTDIQIKYN